MSFVVHINKHGNEKSCPFPVELAVSSVVLDMRSTYGVENDTLSSSPDHTVYASTDLHHDYFRDFDRSDLSIVPQIKKSNSLPNDNLLSLFWNAVWTNRITETEDGLLSLSSGWGSSGVISLYPRKCYSDLINIIYNNPQFTKFLVLGSPGIGKSLFVSYFIYWTVKQNLLSTEKPSFVFSNLDGNEFLFTFDQNDNRPVVLLYERSMEMPQYFISDAFSKHDPPFRKAYIHISSFAKPHHESLQKEISEKGRTWNMPVFSFDEYLKITKFPEDFIKSRFKYDVFGGSARLLSSTAMEFWNLTIFKFIAAQMDVFFADVVVPISSLSSSSPSMVNYKEAVGNDIWLETAMVIGNALSSSSIDLSKRSIFKHLYSCESAGKRGYDEVFASPFMRFLAGSFCAQKHLDMLAEIEKLFRGSDADIAFERIDHEQHYALFKNHGNIEIQHLCGKGEKRKDEIIAPKPRRKVFIRTVEDISLLTPNDYGIPMIPNFPLVDAIIAPNMLIQMTRSDRHTGVIEKLPIICEKLSCPPNNLKMIFILDHANFEEFKMVKKIVCKQYKYKCVGGLTTKRKFQHDEVVSDQDSDAEVNTKQSVLQIKKKWKKSKK